MLFFAFQGLFILDDSIQGTLRNVELSCDLTGWGFLNSIDNFQLSLDCKSLIRTPMGMKHCAVTRKTG